MDGRRKEGKRTVRKEERRKTKKERRKKERPKDGQHSLHGSVRNDRPPARPRSDREQSRKRLRQRVPAGLDVLRSLETRRRRIVGDAGAPRAGGQHRGASADPVHLECG